MSSIADALYRMGYLSSGTDLKITRRGPNGWQRANCPKCGYERAQVHRDRGLFWCPKIDQGKACLKVAVKREWSAVDQFAEMVVKVSGNASVRKYGDWLEPLEIAQLCDECLLRYDRTGDLDKWEADVDGDPSKLRAYVFTALRGDVLNYAQAKVTRIRKGHTPDVEYTPGDLALMSATAAPWEVPTILRTGPKPKVPAVVTYTDQDDMLVIEKRGDLPPSAAKRVAEAEYTADVDSTYPCLTMSQLWGMTQHEIARTLHCNVRQVKYRIGAERKRLEASARARRLIP